MKLAVVGLGHVGLPTALGFAEVGWEVVGTDNAVDKAQMVAEGRSPFYEPDLQDLLSKHLRLGRLPRGGRSWEGGGGRRAARQGPSALSGDWQR